MQSPSVSPLNEDEAADPNERNGSNKKTRWLWYLPAALLIATACTQLCLAQSAGLSPWSGGGFGMFSTLDAGGSRHLHAIALRPGIRRELAIPDSLDEEVLKAITLPSDERLRALARTLAELPNPDSGPLTAMEIQVWAQSFDAKNLDPSGTLLRSISVPFDEVPSNEP
jgi:hypothetical protein